MSGQSRASLLRRLRELLANQHGLPPDWPVHRDSPGSGTDAPAEPVGSTLPPDSPTTTDAAQISPVTDLSPAPAPTTPARRIQWAQPAAPPSQPRPKKGNGGRIEWGGGGGRYSLPDPATLVGVEDAFEHTPLLAGEQVAFCTYDRVAYHWLTWQFLKAQNAGACCVCGRPGHIRMLTLPGTAAVAEPTAPRPMPAWASPGQKIITRAEVEAHMNQAVVVEDYVYDTYQTKATGTWFVRFDPREPGQPPFAGFKVVIFPDYQVEWEMAGQTPRMYRGHTVRVRGVVRQHATWGIEILVNSPRVMQIVEPAKPD